MYNQTYDDYMRSILGYPTNNNNIYNNYLSESPYHYSNTYQQQGIKMDFEELYPEIYKIMYPMIKKACMNNLISNNNVLEEIINEIYNAIENDSTISLNISLEDAVLENRNLNTQTNSIQNQNIKYSQQMEEKRNIQPKNKLLRDLIKILFVRELRENKYDMYPKPNRPPYYYRPRYY